MIKKEAKAVEMNPESKFLKYKAFSLKGQKKLLSEGSIWKTVILVLIMVLFSSFSEAMIKLYTPHFSFTGIIFSLEVGILIGLSFMPKPQKKDFYVSSKKLLCAALLSKLATIILYIYALSRLNLFEFRTLLITCELWCVLFGFLFLKELTSGFKNVALGITFIGAFIAVFNSMSPDFIQNALVLLYTFLVAINATLIKVYLQKHSNRAFVFFMTFSVLIFYGILFFLETKQLTIYWPFVFIGCIRSVARFAEIAAMNSGNMTFFAPLSYIEIIFSAFWGYMILGSVPSLNSIYGAGVIIGGLLLLLFAERRLHSKKEISHVNN